MKARFLGYEPPEVAHFLTGLGYSRFFLDLLCAVPGLHDPRLRRLRKLA